MWFFKVSLIILFGCFTTGSVFAAEPGEEIFIDDFSTDLSNWQVARGSADIWQIESGVLVGNVLTPSTIAELVPKSEIWQSSWQNYRFELDILPMSGVDRNLAWGYQDPFNWYEIHFLPDFFELARLRQGQVAWSESSIFNQFTDGVWHHLKLETVAGQMTIWLDGQVITMVSESNFQANLGTIALKIGTGSVFPVKIKFDNVRVTLLNGLENNSLDVPHVRQDDPEWSDETYDSAADWAVPEAITIKRWGCALSSAAMILNHYGFNFISADQPLNPATLNNWLKTQPDGYLGGKGWVNWLAIVRLARELLPFQSNLSQPLPQLVYGYKRWEDWLPQGLELVKSELMSQRPVILELPGHFVVAKGIAENNQVVLINDPASFVTNLQSLNKVATSGRFWQPIYDPELVSLRYWLVKLPKGLKIKMFTDTGELVEGNWVSQDPPGSIQTEATQSEWSILVWPNPPVGEFTLELARATGDASIDGGEFPVADLPAWLPVKLDFWVYDDQANPTKLTIQTSLDLSHRLWWLVTSQTEPPQIYPTLTWEEWLQIGLDLHSQGLLPDITWARVSYLARLAAVMQGLPNNYSKDEIDLRYASWISQILDQAILKNNHLAGLKHWQGVLRGRWSVFN